MYPILQKKLSGKLTHKQQNLVLLFTGFDNSQKSTNQFRQSTFKPPTETNLLFLYQIVELNILFVILNSCPKNKHILKNTL